MLHSCQMGKRLILLGDTAHIRSGEVVVLDFSNPLSQRGPLSGMWKLYIIVTVSPLFVFKVICNVS